MRILAESAPDLMPKTDALEVLSRDHTVVGCFVNFMSDEDINHTRKAPGEIYTSGRIELPEVEHGAQAVLFVDAFTNFQFLEVFTFVGELPLKVNEFTIHPATTRLN